MPELRWGRNRASPEDKIEVELFVDGIQRGAIVRTNAHDLADYPSIVIRGCNVEHTFFESESLESAQQACERELLDDLDPQTRRAVVRQQWLDTAETLHEKMELQRMWRRQDQEGD
jgi:hypothetical protein